MINKAVRKSKSKGAETMGFREHVEPNAVSWQFKDLYDARSASACPSSVTKAEILGSLPGPRHRVPCTSLGLPPALMSALLRMVNDNGRLILLFRAVFSSFARYYIISYMISIVLTISRGGNHA